MQLTKLDHWLKQKFVYQTYIFCLRLPEKKLGRGVSVKSLETVKTGDFKYKLVIKDNKVAERTFSILKSEHIMHATHIVNGKGLLNKWIMPDKGRSFTWQMVGRLLILMTLCTVCIGVYKLIQNPEFMSKLSSALDEIKVNM
ncbi:MAG: hypothetical protein ACSHX0_04870 [Akkermansiaceae bacterium]